MGIWEHQIGHPTLEVTPNNERYTDMSIGLTKHNLQLFIKSLRKIREKTIKWEEIAKRENVRNMEKGLQKSMDKLVGSSFGYDFVAFNVDGMRLSKRYKDFWQKVTCPKFCVDGNGNCFLVYDGINMGSFKVSTGKAYESTTTVGTPGLFGVTPRASGHSTSQELMKYEPGGFTIRIPVSEIDAYIAMLEEGLRHFDAKKAEKKLFK